MAEVFPPSWRTARALPFVVEMLAALPLSPKDRKRTLEEWAEWADVQLTGTLVNTVTSLPSGEVQTIRPLRVAVVEGVTEVPREEVPEEEEEVIRVVRDVLEEEEEEGLVLRGGGIGGRNI